MVRIRHREDDSPSYYGSDEVETEPGDVVDVDEDTADRMLEQPHFVREEDDDAPAQDADGDTGSDGESAVTTSDFRDDEIEVADAESDGKTEAQRAMDLPDADDDEPLNEDLGDQRADTADFRDDEIDVADVESEGKTEAQQRVDEDADADTDGDADQYAEVVDGTVDDVQAALDDGRVDDLDALEAAERDHGGERVGVMDAIEAARPDSDSETTDDDSGA